MTCNRGIRVNFFVINLLNCFVNAKRPKASQWRRDKKESKGEKQTTNDEEKK